MREVSIILPVHNEEIGIESVIKNLDEIFKKTSISLEIICVENGSTDNSFKKLKKLTKKYHNLRIYQSDKGWGNAVIEGIKHAKGKYCCYIVSDNQVDPKYALTVYRTFIKSDVEMVKVKRINRENVIRFLNSLLYNFICFILFGVSNDINATPKIFKTKILKSIELTSKNIAIDLELLLKLKKRKMGWLNIPIHTNKRSWGSSTTNIKTALEMLRYIIKFKYSIDKDEQ